MLAKDAHPALQSNGQVAPPEVVVEPNDVILSEVVAVLDLDEHQVEIAGVVNTAGTRPS